MSCCPFLPTHAMQLQELSKLWTKKKSARFYPIFKTYGERFKKNSDEKLDLSDALNELCEREQYLALEKSDLRFDMGAKYGLLKAQLALALNGRDRDRVMGELIEFFGMKELNSTE